MPASRCPSRACGCRREVPPTRRTGCREGNERMPWLPACENLLGRFPPGLDLPGSVRLRDHGRDADLEVHVAARVLVLELVAARKGGERLVAFEEDGHVRELDVEIVG